MATRNQSIPKLVIIEGKDKGKVITLKDGTAVIGRTKGDVVVQDPRVSRSHVALHFDAHTGNLSFTDLKSLNGTQVNGTTMDSGNLKDGDKLQLGNTLFDCQLSSDSTVAGASEINTAGQPNSQNPGQNVKEELSFSQSEPAHLSKTETQPITAAKAPGKTNRHKGALSVISGPNRTRNIAVLVLILCGLYFLLPSPPSKPSRTALQKELMDLQALTKAQKWSLALDKAEKLRSRYDEDSEVHRVLGDVLNAQGKYQPALVSYQRARSLNPKDPLISTRLIPLLLRVNLPNEAKRELEQLDRALQEGTPQKELYQAAAELYLEHKELKQPPEKSLILARALQTELEPDSPVGYRLEALALFQTGRNQEALQAIEKGLRISPKDEWLLENLAFAKLALEDVPGALSVVDNWISIHPESNKALLVMAYLKFNDKNYASALPYVQKILESKSKDQGDPLLPEALNLMGQISVQQGQTKEAQAYLQQACQSGFQLSCEHDLVRGVSSQPNSPPPSTK